MKLGTMLRRCGIAVFALLALGATHSQTALLGSLHFRSIGPNPGRIDAVAGVPGDPRTYYIGGLGGLQKTTDGGVTWSSIFNHKPVSSIGAISVAPSDPNVLYIGTGEPNLRNDILYGDGVWRSNDAGKTWIHLGLSATAHITQIAIDPKDANIAYVAANGSFYKANPERGIYKTTDGGKTWTQSLRIDNRTGASAIVIDPSNPHHLFAGMWTAYRKPWTLVSGGPNDGLYESDDAGKTWKHRVGDGLPAGLMGRIGLAFAPSDPKRVYALIESKSGSLWRSHDAGATWKLANTAHVLAQRPFYFSQLSVDPRNPMHVYFLSVPLLESTDGGITTKRLHPPIGDNHQMWIDPSNPDRLIIGSDQGAAISLDAGKHWSYPQLALSQPYHVAVDQRFPYTVCVEIQDAGSACGPNSNPNGSQISPSQWFATQGGESGWIVFSPSNDNLIFGGGYTGDLTRYDRRTNLARQISPWPQDYIGYAARDEKYRFGWTAPLAVTPLAPHRLYFGGNRLFLSRDNGHSWSIISPDLTRNERSKQGPPGGPITHDATSVETYDTLFTIDPSPFAKDTLWVGTDDGLVWLTHDNGAHWNAITVPGLPQYARIDRIVPSPFHAATAYLVADLHKNGDRAPYLFKTTDYGAHWQSIIGNLPSDNYARVILPDPIKPGMLYVGTAHGLYVSFDDGSKWNALRGKLPTTAIYDLTIAPKWDDLIVASHGRGVWILDDIRALQHDTTHTHLFAPRIAYRAVGGRFTYGPRTGGGTSAPYGVPVTFTLATASKAPVTLVISKHGQTIRTLTVKNASAGINRVWWNLRYAAIKAVPKSNVWDDTGFSGPLVLPGKYTVTLHAGSTEQAQSLTVASDPRVPSDIVALREQLGFLMLVRKDLLRMNREITALRAKAAASTKNDAEVTRIDAALAVLLQTKNLAGEDVLRHPIRIYEQLSSLAGVVASENARPRDVDYKVLDLLESQMHAAFRADDALLGRTHAHR